MPKISIQYYNIPEDVAKLIKSTCAGKPILVAAHSGSVEQRVQLLGAGSVSAIGNEFDNLFVVTMPPIGTLTVVRMKYQVWPAVLAQMDCEDTN